MDWRDDLSPGWGKGKYVEHVLKDLPDAKLIELANKCTTNLPAEGKTRHIDDILERITTNDRQAISRVTRISLATAFEGRVLTPNVDFDGFIGSIGFERDSGIYTSFRYDPNGQLVSSDFFSSIKVPATHREALEAFGFLDWSDRRVISFLESLIHPEIRRGSEQTELAALIDTHLRPDGLTPRVTGIISGHPVFSIQRLHSSRHDRPKNIIFASSTKGFKPIIGLADALDNELIVLENEDTCLVYDDPTPNEGLTWVRLADWWAKKQKISNTEEARRSLGARLQEALSSPPERLFFSTYFRTIKQTLGEKLPALIPQVYVHYDPKTQDERRQKRKFLIQRMDFLLLLPENRRIVIEIDGKQHYSITRPSTKYDYVDATNTPHPPMPHMSLPSPQVYADTVRADRELRLRGYEVYRFGGYELRDRTCERLVSDFWDGLFHTHGLTS
nr:hypothetical protein [Myxococcus sp. CA033]